MITAHKDQVPIVAHGLTKTGRVSVASTSKITQIVTSSLYSNPLEAVIRELLANAVDAHMDVIASGGKPQREPTIDYDASSNQLVIADYGTGIEPSRVADLLLAVGGTSKDSDNTRIGGWGLGAKSPYALADQWHFENRYNGVTYTYLCFQQDGDLAFSGPYEHPSPDRPNGLTFRIPIDSKRANEIRDFVAFYGAYSAIAPFSGNTQIVPNHKRFSQSHTLTIPAINAKIVVWRASDLEPNLSIAERPNSNGGSIIAMGGVPYPTLDQPSIDWPNVLQVPEFVIEVPIGFFDLTPSRDNIRGSQYTLAQVKALADTLLAWVASDFRNMLDAPKVSPYTILDYFERLRQAHDPKHARTFTRLSSSAFLWDSSLAILNHARANKNLAARLIAGSDITWAIDPVPSYAYSTPRQPAYTIRLIDAIASLSGGPRSSSAPNAPEYLVVDFQPKGRRHRWSSKTYSADTGAMSVASTYAHHTSSIALYPSTAFLINDIGRGAAKLAAFFTSSDMPDPWKTRNPTPVADNSRFSFYLISTPGHAEPIKLSRDKIAEALGNFPTYHFVLASEFLATNTHLLASATPKAQAQAATPTIATSATPAGPRPRVRRPKLDPATTDLADFFSRIYVPELADGRNALETHLLSTYSLGKYLSVTSRAALTTKIVYFRSSADNVLGLPWPMHNRPAKRDDVAQLVDQLASLGRLQGVLRDIATRREAWSRGLNNPNRWYLFVGKTFPRELLVNWVDGTDDLIASVEWFLADERGARATYERVVARGLIHLTNIPVWLYSPDPDDNTFDAQTRAALTDRFCATYGRHSAIGSSLRASLRLARENTDTDAAVKVISTAYSIASTLAHKSAPRWQALSNMAFMRDQYSLTSHWRDASRAWNALLAPLTYTCGDTSTDDAKVVAHMLLDHHPSYLRELARKITTHDPKSWRVPSPARQRRPNKP